MTKEIKSGNRAFLMLIIVYLGGSILLGYILDKTGANLNVWIMLAISQGMVVIPMLLYALVTKTNIIKHCHYKKTSIINILLTFAYTACCMPIVWFVNFISMLFVENEIQDVSMAFLEYPFLVQLFFMAVLPGFVEEFVFRGIIYRKYRAGGAHFGAALLSGALFGMLHLNINQFMYAMVLGVLFALLVEMTDSIWTSTLAHFLVNSFSVVLTYLLNVLMKFVSDNSEVDMNALMEESQNATTGVGTTIMQFFMFFSMAIAGVAGLYLCYLGFRKHNKKKEEMKEYFKPQEKAKLLTPSVIIAMIICIAYMIYAEIA